MLHLPASSGQTQDWHVALDADESATALLRMTLYKSKGLEHHTVIFAGLDDDASWSRIPEPVDVAARFFAAFTRARQRTKVAPLFERLDKDGVLCISLA